MKKETVAIVCIFFIVLANSFSIITNSVFSEMHWTVFTYEFGFIKRGLIGEILSIVFDKPGRGTVIALSSCVMAAAVSALSFLYLRPYAHANKNNVPHIWLFGILALSHFSTIQFTIFDTGRFDQFGILFMTLSIVVIEHFKGLKVTAAIIILSALGILIHEAYFLMFFPLVFFYWVFRDEKKTDKLAALALIMALVLYVGLYGNLKHTISRQDYLAHCASNYGPWISEQPVWILYTTTLQHIRVTTQNFGLAVFYKAHAIWFIALLPSLLIVQKMIRLLYTTLAVTKDEGEHTGIIVLLFLSPFSPLILYFLGVDFGRWLSICVINVFVFLSIFLYTNKTYMQKCSGFLGKNKTIIMIAVVLSLLLGPLVKSQGFVWNFGYPPAARSCLNVARVYYGEYDATYEEIRDKITQTIKSW